MQTTLSERCLWLHTSAEAPLNYPALHSQEEAEVCVVGGGITGLSTALHLAEKGIKVILLEAGEIPSGGSGRNVGLVNAGLWIPPDDIVATLGEEKGERANTVLGGAPSKVFGLIERHAIACDATRTGTLHLGHNSKGCQALERRLDQLQKRGAPVSLLTGEACEQITGTSKIHAALLDKRAGTLNPCAYTRGLARAATNLGATLYCQSAVTGIERQADCWSLLTQNGRVTADRVVMATNAYTEDDWNQVRQHFFTGHYYQLASQPLTGAAAESILPDKQGSWDTRTVLSSIRRDKDGRLLLGSLGKGEGKPLAYLTRWADTIQNHYFPALGKVRWEYTWTGKIAFTPEHTLRIFEPAPGILSATGYNGRGITTGTVVGEGFAHYITTGEDSLLPLPLSQPKPIKARPLWSCAYEGGFSLYHAGQCLRVLI
ncbi:MULTISPECIES: L-pipecolate oxidase [unclassified Halomonas]|uniref:L-pipecolate oxidase n=1 Tax=unclassified Halomonas TaxID=2609666 RepID=UPI0009903EA2|nr:MULTISPECIES: FAD-binding oxidoreductase [unclassified Halomonas]AQU84066.1 FAD-dependent oxidoreductase [Halomonas sp. 'Soap Lake \